MSALTPICVLCRLEMRCVKNDRLVRDPETNQFSSTYWLGDEFQCPVCSIRIVTGFGKPMVMSPGPEYGEALQFDYERPREPAVDARQEGDAE